QIKVVPNLQSAVGRIDQLDRPRPVGVIRQGMLLILERALPAIGNPAAAFFLSPIGDAPRAENRRQITTSMQRKNHHGVSTRRQGSNSTKRDKAGACARWRKNSEAYGLKTPWGYVSSSIRAWGLTKSCPIKTNGLTETLGC